MNQNEKARREAIERAITGRQTQQEPVQPVKPAPEPPKRAIRPKRRSNK